MKKSYETYHVFTPTSVANLNYITRSTINTRMVSALRTPGKQLIIFGHSGVGKSSLIRNTLKELYEGEIVTNCMAGMTFNSVILDAFDQLNDYYIDAIKHIDTTTRKTSLESDYFAIKAQIEASTTITETLNETRLVPVQLTPQRLADFIGKANYCWVLEDFHKMDQNEKIKLSQIMKIFMDKSVDYPYVKIIALGAVNSGREVVKYDEEMKNRVSEIEVQLMSTTELEEILSNGEQFLNINFTKTIKKEIAKFSNGLASVCHAIALYLCEDKDIYTTSNTKISFTQKDLEEVIIRYMEESSDTIKEKFEKALKQKKGKFKNAELIFRALSKFPSDGATHADLISTIKDEARDYPASNLTKNLTNLQKPEKGAIIIENTSAGKYLFAEPLYRPFAIALLKNTNSKDTTIDDKSLQTLIGRTAYDAIIKELEKKYNL